MGWGEYFIIREMNEQFDQLAQQLRVAISHSARAGGVELQKCHAHVQALQKQYRALEQVMRANDEERPALPSAGDKVLDEVRAELEQMRGKLERLEQRMTPKRRKKAPP